MNSATTEESQATAEIPLCQTMQFFSALLKEYECYRLESVTNTAKAPLFLSPVRAGFPSPADDYIEDHLDLNEYLIKHPASTFLLKAKGDSMSGAGIESGDILIVDRSITPAPGKVVIAAIDGELTVKRLAYHNNHLCLVPANPLYSPIDIKGEQDFVIWGVVTHIIHHAL